MNIEAALRRAFCAMLPGVLVLAASAASRGEDALPPSSPSLPVETHTIKDGAGRTVTYYVNHPPQRVPILLMIQGSGCVPVMNPGSGHSLPYSTLYDFLPLAQEAHFTVIAVEKPFTGMVEGDKPGTAVSCSAAFNDDFTADSWLRALQAALDDARRLPWVDKRRTLVLGESEGAVMAAMLAGHDSRVTDVVLIGGSGTTQLFDFVALAYRHCFDVSPCLADLDKQVAAIHADPMSATKFAWGHPYRRWTSFFHVDAGDELLRSKARVYIAFGTGDESVPALSEEITVAKLEAAARDVTVRRVPNAGHNLVQPNSPNWNDLDKEMRLSLAWFGGAHDSK